MLINRKGLKTLLYSELLLGVFEILQHHGHSPLELSLDYTTRELLLQEQLCGLSILTTEKSLGSESTGVLWTQHCLEKHTQPFPGVAFCCSSWVIDSATKKPFSGYQLYFKLIKFPTICLFFNTGFSSSWLGEENVTGAPGLARKILSWSASNSWTYLPTKMFCP